MNLNPQNVRFATHHAHKIYTLYSQALIESSKVYTLAFIIYTKGVENYGAFSAVYARCIYEFIVLVCGAAIVYAVTQAFPVRSRSLTRSEERTVERRGWGIGELF